MTTRPRSSTLPSYKFVLVSETSGAGVQVSSAGDYTAKDTWALVPGGLTPVNLAPVTATSPATSTIRGQDATAGFASAGGDINITPGVGSVGNVSGNVTIKDTAGNSGWNTSHLRMGLYHFWVDALGRLRVKNSAPTSDTDGTVVGTQT